MHVIKWYCIMIDLSEESAVFLCRIRNVLQEEILTDQGRTVEEHLASIAPVSTTGQTYFGWDGKTIGGWGEIRIK